MTDRFICENGHTFDEGDDGPGTMVPFGDTYIDLGDGGGCPECGAEYYENEVEEEEEEDGED
jgi:hypothetical protein